MINLSGNHFKRKIMRLCDLNKSRKIRLQKGQSLVELAITITLILTLLAGAFDLGNAFLDYIALRDAAQEGAVFGSIYRSASSDPQVTTPIVTRVKQSSTSPLDFSTFIESCSLTVEKGICIEFTNTEISNAAQCTGDTITVTIRYQYHLIMPFLGAIIGSQTIPLQAVVTNVLLLPYCQ